MQKRKLEELSLMDDFLFNAMLTHPETGEKFTNKILKLLFNEDLKDIQEMVDVVKRDGEVSLQYMKSFEHDQLMYAEYH